MTVVGKIKGDRTPVRIAVVIPKYGLVGGAEGYAVALTDCLGKYPEFDIHVFANAWRQGNGPVTFHKIPIIPFPRWIRPISFAWFTKQSLRRHTCHIVHSHERIFHMDLLTCHCIPHRTWTMEVRKKRLSLFDMATGWVEKKGISSEGVFSIMAVSQLVKEELVKTYDVPESKLRVIHPGICLEKYRRSKKEDCRRKIRDRHGLSYDDIVVLFVGMNFEIKNLDTVMHGLSEVAKNREGHSCYKLLVVGKGKTDRYLHLASQLGVSDRVVFAGIQNRIEEYYLGSDIFIMPSEYDTFGMAVLEAMAGGLPVIITDRVGAKDLVEHGESGFVLCQNPDPKEIGRALSLLKGASIRQKMGAKGQAIAWTKDWQEIAKEMVELYNTIAKEKLGTIGFAK